MDEKRMKAAEARKKYDAENIGNPGDEDEEG